MIMMTSHLLAVALALASLDPPQVVHHEALHAPAYIGDAAAGKERAPMKFLVRSRTFDFAAGKILKFPPWIPAIGPTGRRTMVDGLLLRCAYNLDVATAVVQGEDAVAYLFNNVRITTVGNERLNLPGWALRAYCALQLGPAAMFESADIAVATPSTGQIAIYIPFAKPIAFDGNDFSIAADVIKDVEITCPTQASLDLGTSAVTINAGTTFDVLAVCREAEKVEFPQFDVVGITAMETLTQGTIPVNGGFLAEVFAGAAGTPGAASMANWDSHYLVGVAPEPMTEDDWRFLHGLWRQAAPNDAGTPGGEIFNDPFRQNRARIVWATSPGSKLNDHPFVSKSVVVKAVNTVADVQLIHRVITPYPANEEQLVRSAWGAGAPEVKAPGNWGAKSPFMPRAARGRRG